MANIQQAAKWMQEGKHVTRPVRDFEIVSGEGTGGRIFFEKSELGFVEARGCCKEHESKAMLLVEDLLADDWQLAE
jgi:hypothetical protein